MPSKRGAGVRHADQDARTTSPSPWCLGPWVRPGRHATRALAPIILARRLAGAVEEIETFELARSAFGACIDSYLNRPHSAGWPTAHREGCRHLAGSRRPPNL